MGEYYVTDERVSRCCVKVEIAGSGAGANLKVGVGGIAPMRNWGTPIRLKVPEISFLVVPLHHF